MSIQQKPKTCKSCGESKYIFSRGRCKFCATKEDSKPLKNATEKSKEKRKEERKDFPKFFMDAIDKLKLNPVCQNCGGKINANYEPSWNIAHILLKAKFKSVSTHPDNYVFLCSSKDPNTNYCHEAFDSDITNRPNMPVYTIAKEKYLKFRDEVLEFGRERTIFEEN
jgi:hypothetical protein